MKYNLLFTVFFLFAMSMNAQVKVSGTAVDASNKEPVPFLQVVIYQYKSDRIAVHGFSDEAGRFEIVLPLGEGLYTLKTSSLTHQNIEKDIVVDDATTAFVKLNIELKKQSFSLSSVQVTARLPPVIVKKDTTIYNVESFSEETDQTLEDVLARIPGFEIKGNGDIKVKGKSIQKVLINGEELTDGGAALLTRGINPERVKNVEVRFKEKDDKIRESLLSTNDLAVLDIKLKDDFSTSFFGRGTVRGGVGENIGLQPGGTLNAFSLNKIIKFHLISEYDRFGDQSISLANIKNIGKEAYATLFDVPADFSTIKRNPEYQNEIYGFKEADDYTIGSVGVTGKATLTPQLDLFVGSYNYLTETTVSGQSSQQSLLDGETFSFGNTSRSQIRGSKNKFELKFDRPGLKASYNFNAVFTENLYRQNLSFGEVGGRNFDNRNKKTEFYHNLNLEQKINDKSGYHLSLFASSFSGLESRKLDVLDNNLGHVLGLNTTGSIVFRQEVPLNGNRLLAEGYYQFAVAGQIFRSGLRLLKDRLEANKQAFLGDSLLISSSFSAKARRLDFQQLLPYVELVSGFGVFDLRQKIALSINQYPTVLGMAMGGRSLWELSSQASLNLGDGDAISLNFSQQTSRFSLAQLLAGQDLIDFQTIARSGRYNLVPNLEQTVQLSANTWTLDELGVGIEVGAIAGRVNNVSSFSFDEFSLIIEDYDQLESKYVVGLMKVAKVFSKIPLQLKLENSLIYNRTENRAGGEVIFPVDSRIRLSKFQVQTTFKKSAHQLKFSANFNNLQFGNGETSIRQKQNIRNLVLRHQHALARRKCFLTVNWRHVQFSGHQNSSLLLVDVEFMGKVGPLKIRAGAQNVLNCPGILTQRADAGIIVSDERNIFGRFLKLGITFDIN